MAGSEKRVKLGVDIGELSNQLLQIENITDSLYKKSIQGQLEYNKLLEQSVSLLTEQAGLLNNSGGANDIISFDSNAISPNEGNGDDTLKRILENIEKIWDKMNEGSQSGISSNEEIEKPENEEDEARVDKVTHTKNEEDNSVKDTVKTGANAANQIVQKDPNYILAGAVNLIPWVGVALSAISSKLIAEAEELEKSTYQLRAVRGDSNNLGNFNYIGLSSAEALAKQAEYYRANVYLSKKDLEFEKGFGLSSGTLDSLLRSFRQDVNRELGSASNFGFDYLSMLENRGRINSKEVRGYAEDYLKILVELNQKQLEVTGQTNTFLNSYVIEGIAGLSKKFEDPTILNKVVTGIYGGLTQAVSPQVEALQYYALSKENPNASIWDMQLMREDPFGEKSKGYFANFLEALLATGNDNDAKFNIQSVFGLSAHQTEELVNGIRYAQKANFEIYRDEKTGQFSLSKYLERNKLNEDLNFYNRDFKNYDDNIIEKEAIAATSGTSVLTAKATDYMAEAGMPLLKATSVVITKIGESVDKIEKWLGDNKTEESNTKSSGKIEKKEFPREHLSGSKKEVQENNTTSPYPGSTVKNGR